MGITIVRRTKPLSQIDDDLIPDEPEELQSSAPPRPVRAARGTTIIAVAIRRPSDGVYWYAHRPARHGDVIHSLVEKLGIPAVPGDWEQGFVTSRLRFVDRKEAMLLAKANKQMKRASTSDELYSEDLW